MTHVLVTISDVTAKMRAEEAERRQREQLDIFRRIHRDRLDFMLFFREAEALVTEISEGRGDPTEQLRQVHTLKGNAGLYGLGLLASGMHEVESRAKQDCGALSVESRARVSALWAEVRELVTPLLGSIDRDPDAPGAVHIPLATHEALLQAIARGEDHRALHERVVQLGWQPALIPLQKLREQAMLTCARAGDRQATVRIEGDDVRLPPHRWRHFWSAAVHLVRNAIDHGIEPAAQRAALGKPEVGTITLRAQVSQRDTLGGGQLTLEFVDDGRGIDWGRVRERARALGLPAESQQDLTAAIFADGVSTRDELTETSGRGVGLAAVASATRALDGVIEVESAANGGTCIRFAFPLTTVGAPALRLSA
jgi:two-component system chemotaxis sensor kinase CheA